MVKINKLKGKMVENELTQQNLAKAAGISLSTIYKRFKEHGESFTVIEVNAIAKALKLTDEELLEIFFRD